MILVLPSPAPDVIARAKAPDGRAWPIPTVLVDGSEQTPIAFGHVPAVWTIDAPVHYGNLAARDVLFDGLASRYPWPCHRANLAEGDYALGDPRTPGAPITQWIAIETKRGDLVSSFTATRPQLEAEFARLAGYRYPRLVASVSVEALVGADGRETAEGMRERAAQKVEDIANDMGKSEAYPLDFLAAQLRALPLSSGVPMRQPRGAASRERSLIGTLEALSIDYRIPMDLMPDRRWAEYVVAWSLLRAWRVWLVEVPEGLAEVRRLEMCERAANGEGVRA